MRLKHAHVAAIVLAVAVSLAAAAILAGCSAPKPAEPAEKPAEPAEKPAEPPKPVERKALVLATTTSTADTGLLDVLNAEFEKKYPYTVKTIAVGTGEALKLGEKKEADVLLVHARKSEDEFMAKGLGTRRFDVMYNDFVLVGPKDDPAKIRGMKPSEALAKIASGKFPFVTRGDDSGTHKKEKELWAAAKITPEGQWYVSTGQGMGASLKIASEKKAYILADRGTYLATKSLDLDIILEKDASMLNPYGVIEVKDAKNAEGAKAYAEFITSDEGQKIIGEFGKDKYGQALFVPDAKK